MLAVLPDRRVARALLVDAAGNTAARAGSRRVADAGRCPGPARLLRALARGPQVDDVAATRHPRESATHHARHRARGTQNGRAGPRLQPRRSCQTRRGRITRRWRRKMKRKPTRLRWKRRRMEKNRRNRRKTRRARTATGPERAVAGPGHRPHSRRRVRRDAGVTDAATRARVLRPVVVVYAAAVPVHALHAGHVDVTAIGTVVVVDGATVAAAVPATAADAVVTAPAHATGRAGKLRNRRHRSLLPLRPPLLLRLPQLRLPQLQA